MVAITLALAFAKKYIYCGPDCYKEAFSWDLKINEL